MPAEQAPSDRFGLDHAADTLRLALASIQSFETGQRVTIEPTVGVSGHAD